MNRARIEELAGAIAIANSSLNASVQRALTTLARECYEEAAKQCELVEDDALEYCSNNDRSIYDAGRASAANMCHSHIRALAEEVGK